jgi:hypothetical protein
LALELPSVLPYVPCPTSINFIQLYVRTLPTTQRRFLADLQQQASDIQVWRAFRLKAQLYIASDGGLDGDKEPTAGSWLPKWHILFLGSGPVDGFASTESSTRSELVGCASSLLLAISISRLWWGHRHRSSFRWITDSVAAISRLRKYVFRDRRATKMPDNADLISLIATLIRELRCPFRPERMGRGPPRPSSVLQEASVQSSLEHQCGLSGNKISTLRATDVISLCRSLVGPKGVHSH